MALALALALGVLGRTADAQKASGQPLLTVDIRDYALVPRVHMTSAVAQVSAILDNAGVKLVCKVERRSISDKRLVEPMPGKVITVDIDPPWMADRIAVEPTTLGTVPGAASGGRLAYVFSSRVEVIAKRYSTDYGALLGTVLAHEIGHILLPGRPHSLVGLMRPVCDGKQVHDVMLGALAFTPAQTAAIRSGLF